MSDWRKPRWYETKPKDIKGRANKKSRANEENFFSDEELEENAITVLSVIRLVIEKNLNFFLLLLTIPLLISVVGDSFISKIINQISQYNKSNYASYLVRVLMDKNLPNGSAAVCEENNLLSNRILYLETQYRNELIAIKTDFKISKCVPSDLPFIKLSETDFSKLYSQKQANLKEEKITIVKIIK